MQQVNVLLVDDDLEQRDITAFALRRDGFAVVEASDEPQALRRFRLDRPDIVVVDLELLSPGGVELIRHIRAERRTPLLVTIGRSDTQEVLRSLEFGADDFITKPYICQELALRLRAIARRAGRTTAPEPEAILQVGDLRLDPEAHTAARGSFEVRLTPTEFRICYTLLKNAEHVVPANRLLTFVGGTEVNAANTLRSHICHLRRKLALDGPLNGSIASVPAVGYVFRGSRQNEGAAPADISPVIGGS